MLMMIMKIILLYLCSNIGVSLVVLYECCGQRKRNHPNPDV